MHVMIFFSVATWARRRLNFFFKGSYLCEYAFSVGAILLQLDLIKSLLIIISNYSI